MATASYSVILVSAASEWHVSDIITALFCSTPARLSLWHIEDSVQGYNYIYLRVHFQEEYFGNQNKGKWETP